jgi:hypothetical protein
LRLKIKAVGKETKGIVYGFLVVSFSKIAIIELVAPSSLVI